MKTPHDLVKAVDKEVHRWHMHRTKDWSKKKIIKTALTLNGLSFATGLAASVEGLGNVHSYLFGMAIGSDFVNTAFYALDHDSGISYGTKARPRETPIYSVLKKSRPYLFLAGATSAGTCVYNLANLFLNNEPLPSDFSLRALLAGETLGLTSSMYIKDRDPKLLQRDNAFKRAYNWVTGKLTPTPVPSYQTLVEKVEANY